MNSSRKFIGIGIISNIAMLFGGINLYLNDRLRAELKNVIEENKLKQTLKEAHGRSAKRFDHINGRIEVRNKINGYRRVLTSYAEGITLETGCGTGRNFIHYKPHHNVIAVDYSNEMLSRAAKKKDCEDNEDGTTNEVSCKNIQLKNVDCEELDKHFGKGSFDSIVDFMNMQAYCNPELVLAQMKYVLKDKGKLIIMCRGESEYALINMFYKIFYPSTLMKHGLDYCRNWDDFLLKDPELDCIYNTRRNYGKTYLYVFELNKKDI